MMTLHEVNRLTSNEFSAALGAIYEHSPWIAERAFALKPGGGFASRAQVHAALVATVQSAFEVEKVALLNAHPELAGKEAAAGTLTSASTAEQASAGLTAMTAADVAQLRELNAAYREKFDFPFIIAVRNNCLMQVGEIARLRLMDLISD
jgi:2-oxo-4-hydroxy-4-carboxy-5-ureidoimidazoline decarboxylase